MTPRARLYAEQSAARNQVTVDEIFSRDRTRRVVTARNEVMRRLRWQDGFTTSQIGRWMGRDRSTVLHATKVEL